MKVIALKSGFIDGKRIRAGAEFEVPETFKAIWVAPVTTAAAKAAVEATKVTKQKPMTLSQSGKQETKTFLDVHAEKTDLA
jgi:hypothetical protein